MALADERCSRSPRLEHSELEALQQELDPAWDILDGQRLHRTIRLPDFAQGLALVNAIGAVAEEQDHHPDLLLAWGRVEITLWTHERGGLTRADLVLAAKIDGLVP